MTTLSLFALFSLTAVVCLVDSQAQSADEGVRLFSAFACRVQKQVAEAKARGEKPNIRIRMMMPLLARACKSLDKSPAGAGGEATAAPAKKGGLGGLLGKFRGKHNHEMIEEEPVEELKAEDAENVEA